MYVNNFDTNSTGQNIELKCYRDVFISQINFEENIKILQYGGYRSKSIGFYTAHGQLDYEIEYEVKGLKSNMVKFLNKEIYHVWSMGDYISDMEREIIDRLPEYNILDLSDYNSILGEYGLEIKYKNDIRIIEVRGYSQGDCSWVICDFTELKKLWGVDPNEHELEKTLTRLYYDAPIYACFEINGKEYNYYDYVNDEYDWIPYEFAKLVSADSGVGIDTLMEMLPVYPPY